MKHAKKNITISLSILTIASLIYTDWQTDIERYYSNPYDAESYIDLNKNISMESYIGNHAQPFPGSIKENSLQIYPFPNRNERKELYFQPCDGSLKNGIVEILSKTATTSLHEYDNVIMIDGTVKTPKLQPDGSYKDAQGNTLNQIGSLILPALDESPSDKSTYYIFGKIKSTTKNPNKALQDYNSQGE